MLMLKTKIILQKLFKEIQRSGYSKDKKHVNETDHDF